MHPDLGDGQTGATSYFLKGLGEQMLQDVQNVEDFSKEQIHAGDNHEKQNCKLFH